MRVNEAVARLIGTPYSVLDCWGIVREFYRVQFNYELQSYYDTVPESRDKAKLIVLNSMKDFEEVKSPEMGDLILIRLFGIESHIAVYIGEDMMLHTSEHSGCIVENLGRWRKLIVGFYRVKRTNND